MRTARRQIADGLFPRVRENVLSLLMSDREVRELMEAAAALRQQVEDRIRETRPDLL